MMDSLGKKIGTHFYPYYHKGRAEKETENIAQSLCKNMQIKQKKGSTKTLKLE